MTMVIKSSRSLRERKKLVTRQCIIREAIRLFSARGFDAPTIEEIASAAQVGKGTVYNYFSSKEEILVAFLVGIEQRVQGRLRHFGASKAPLGRILSEFVRFQFRLKRPYHPFIKVLLSQLILRGPELEDHVERMHAYVQSPLLALFTCLQKRGLIPRDADIPALIRTFIELHFGLNCLWAMEGPPFRDALRAVDEQMAIFSESLERKKA